MKKKLLFCLLAVLNIAIAANTATAQHDYIDENGVPVTVYGETISNTSEYLGDYYDGGDFNQILTSDVTITNSQNSLYVGLNDNVSLYLYDGATLTVDNIYINGGTLTIYGQENGTGTINATSIAIRDQGSLTINGGTINAPLIGSDELSYTRGSLYINGGIVSTEHINTTTTYLSFRTINDQITVSNTWNGTAIVADGKAYIIGTETYQGTLTNEQRDALINKQLKAAEQIPVSSQPQAVTGLTYDSETHDLITPGASEQGTFLYATSINGPYSEEIPSGVVADNYEIYYMVKGNGAYADIPPSESTKIEVSIAEADFFVVDNIKYYIIDKTNNLVQIGNGSDKAWNSSTDPTTITIPSEVEYEGVSYTVTKIGDKAFNYVGYSKLTTVSFAENNKITSIGASAFANNRKLGNINLENCVNLTSIGESAFSYTMADGGDYSIIIPSGVTEIKASTFSICSSLKNVTFQGTITKIGDYAFAETGLGSIDLSNVQEIGSSAFNQCAITSLVIPASVKTIGNEAFSSCQHLTSVTFETDGALRAISNGMFFGAGDSDFPIAEITIPSNITTIGDGAFNQCNFQKITFEEGVTTFGDNLFYYLHNKEDLEIIIEAQNPTLGKNPFGTDDTGTPYKSSLCNLKLNLCADQNVKYMWEEYFDAPNTQITNGTKSYTVQDDDLKGHLPATKEYDGSALLPLTDANFTANTANGIGNVNISSARYIGNMNGEIEDIIHYDQTQDPSYTAFYIETQYTVTPASEECSEYKYTYFSDILVDNTILKPKNLDDEIKGKASSIDIEKTKTYDGTTAVRNFTPNQEIEVDGANNEKLVFNVTAAEFNSPYVSDANQINLTINLKNTDGNIADYEYSTTIEIDDASITKADVPLPTDFSALASYISNTKTYDGISEATVTTTAPFTLTGVNSEEVPGTLTADFAISEDNGKITKVSNASDENEFYGMLVKFTLDKSDTYAALVANYNENSEKFYTADDVQGVIKAPAFTATYGENTKNFATLKEALEYTYPSDITEITIKQVDDYNEEMTAATTINITKKFTLDLSSEGKDFEISNNNKLKFSIKENASLTINAPSSAQFKHVNFFVNGGGTLTINDGVYTSPDDDGVIAAYGKVIINGGNFTSISDVALINVYGEASISGGSFDGGTSAISLSVYDGADVKLSGGTFKCSHPYDGTIYNSNYYDDDATTLLLVEGYQFVDDNNSPIEEKYDGSYYFLQNADGTFAKEVTVQKVPEAYAVLSDDGKTLTFKYDGEKPDVNAWSLNEYNTNSTPPGWLQNSANIEKVVFDATFTNARPTTCAQWFSDFEKLTEITGLEYLNTTEVKDMSFMFDHCVKLTNITFGTNFKTGNVTNMDFMFADCHKLTTIKVGSNWNTEKVRSSNNMFQGDYNLIGNYGAMVDVSKYNSYTNDVAKANCTEQGGYLTTGNYKIFYDLVSDDGVSDLATASELASAFATNSPAVTEFAHGAAKPINNPKDLTGNPFKGWTGAGITEPTKNLTIAADDPGNRIYTANWTVNREAYAVYDDTDGKNTLTFYFDANKPDAGSFALNTADKAPDWGSKNADVLKVVFDDSFQEYKGVNSCYQWFKGFSKLTALDLRNLKTSNVTDMTSMFDGCSSLTGILISDNWNTDKVTESENMFTDCTSLIGEGGEFASQYGDNDKTYAYAEDEHDNYGLLTKDNFKIFYTLNDIEENGGDGDAQFSDGYYDNYRTENCSDDEATTLETPTWTNHIFSGWSKVTAYIYNSESDSYDYVYDTEEPLHQKSVSPGSGNMVLMGLWDKNHTITLPDGWEVIDENGNAIENPTAPKGATIIIKYNGNKVVKEVQVETTN